MFEMLSIWMICQTNEEVLYGPEAKQVKKHSGWKVWGSEGKGESEYSSDYLNLIRHSFIINKIAF